MAMVPAAVPVEGPMGVGVQVTAGAVVGVAVGAAVVGVAVGGVLAVVGLDPQAARTRKHMTTRPRARVRATDMLLLPFLLCEACALHDFEFGTSECHC
jgi:hypothetical protein